MAGATMEEGRADRGADRATAQRLRFAAARLFPALLNASYTAAAGVRAATRDGLPLVGPWRRPGVILACGARRNGWLLAPLMAQVIVERLLGGPASPAARAFDPARFAAP
jgi:glycine oxidase